MSDKPAIPKGVNITEEQLERIAGGECSPAEYTSIIGDLRTNYDALVDFTSYVIERVANSTTY